MQSSNAPNKIQLPFAASGTKNTIPLPSQQGITPGAASFTDGFPPLTFTPLSAGGVPPAGADFNGIFNALSAIQQWQSSGGFFQYDAAQSAAINGYPKGAILLNATWSGFWISTAENNTANPDTGGAGWVAFMPHGKQIFTSSGTFTVPTGVTQVWVSGCGGGGGGGSNGGASSGNSAASSGGGGGGASIYNSPLTVTPLTVIPVTIGAGGTATAQGSGGTSGGTTTFGSFFTLGGGGGGGAGTPNSVTCAGGAGGNGGTGGTSSQSGGMGSDTQGNVQTGGESGAGGSTPYGLGGASVKGDGGDAKNGNNGSGYGAGGSGSGGVIGNAGGVGASGGNGTPGIIIVEW